MIRFFTNVPDRGQRVADNNDFRFVQLLDVHCPAAALYEHRLAKTTLSCRR
jgi:hypothetical protein